MTAGYSNAGAGGDPGGHGGYRPQQQQQPPPQQQQQQPYYTQLQPVPINAPQRRGAYSGAVPEFAPSSGGRSSPLPYGSPQQNHQFYTQSPPSSSHLGTSPGFYPSGSSPQFRPYSPQPPSNNPPRNSSIVSNHPYLPSLQSLSLSGPRSYYATPEDGPPYKLSVVHPDQKTLGALRERALNGAGLPPGTDGMGAKVAWSKQVLKFIERHQSTAGESSRINDPILVRWTDEALNHILTSASSLHPVPLSLYLRGDLSSSGSFPSYRAKDAKAAFRDFESAANLGYEKAWFRIGRAYEEFGDLRRAVSAYEKGVEKGDCGSTYRLAMAYLLGQIGVHVDYKMAVGLVVRAADMADLDTPQPPYILGMLLTGEFESPVVQLPNDIVPINLEEAKWRIERAAYLSFGPAQYKMGFSYEYATLGCLFDPLLSVQYYALASQNGEVEADMALSKWYLCGSEGHFEKNEALAVTFAEKAASRNLPSAEFALGYYREVGINGLKDVEQAKRWYARAASHGNLDAQDRLAALAISDANALSRSDHELQIDTKLVRKRTQAQARSNEQRERLEAIKLANTLANHSRNSSGNSPGYRNHSPNRMPAHQGGNGLNPYSDRPRSNQSVDAETKLRRRDTMRQVEVAAVMNMLDQNGRVRSTDVRGGSASSGGAMSNHSSHSNGGQSNRKGYQLSDRPSAASSASGGHNASKPAAVELRTKPETFADMGIVTQKAKKDECLMM